MSADLLELGIKLKGHEWNIILWPETWDNYTPGHALNWRAHRLSRDERPNIPNEPGIYTLVVQPGIATHPLCAYLMYIGQTDSLRRRFGEYLTKEKKETGRPLLVRLLGKCPDHVWFCFADVPLDRLDAEEDSLLDAFVPPCNPKIMGEIGRARKAFG